MAAAEMKIAPLITVIEQLRVDNNESALMHDEASVEEALGIFDEIVARGQEAG